VGLRALRAQPKTGAVAARRSLPARHVGVMPAARAATKPRDSANRPRTGQTAATCSSSSKCDSVVGGNCPTEQHSTHSSCSIAVGDDRRLPRRRMPSVKTALLVLLAIVAAGFIAFLLRHAKAASGKGNRVRPTAYKPPGATLGLALAGVPAVFIAAYVVKELDLKAVKWLVAVVVVYTAVTLLRAARAERTASAAPATPPPPRS
jgi:hypothetical protein